MGSAVTTATDLRAPQDGSPHAVVPAPNALPWPTRPMELSVSVAGAGRLYDLDDFLETTATTAFVVVVDGVLVHERYFAGTTSEDRLVGNSATKSALALLTGGAMRSGAIAGLDVAVCDLVPELAGSGYASVTLRHLLSMTTGLDWSENYHDPESRASRFLARSRSGEGGIRDLLADIGPAHPPGTRFSYCTPDSLVLDWARERATGEPFAAALGEMWAAIGAEVPAIIGLDAPETSDGIALAGSALAATARDWARLGVLQIDGSWQGERLVDAAWVNASSQPEKSFLAPGRLPSTITTHAGFGYHWWPLDRAGSRVTADGMRGQFVYVDRGLRTVVVKTSAWPYDDPWWDRQCRDLCYLALPAIAEAAAGAGAGAGALSDTASAMTSPGERSGPTR